MSFHVVHFGHLGWIKNSSNCIVKSLAVQYFTNILFSANVMQWPKKLQVYYSLALSRILPRLLLFVINWSPISRLNQSTSKSRPHPSQYLNKSQRPSLTHFRPAVTYVCSLPFLIHQLISECNTDSKLIKVLSNHLKG